MEKEEKLIIAKTMLLSILTIVISICILFFIAVAKVDAAEITCGTRFTYGSDIVNGTPASTNTTFGSTTIGSITQTGHYTNFNNIQFEAICTNNGQAFPAGTYSVSLTGQLTLNSTINTMLKDMTWQSQIRDSTNTAVTTSNKQFIIQTKGYEIPNQSAYFFFNGSITLTSSTSQLRFVFKSTQSITSYGTYNVRVDQINVNGTGSGDQGIIDAIENNTNGMVNGFNDAIDGISSIGTTLDGIGSQIGGINSNVNTIKNNTTTTNNKLDNIIGNLNNQILELQAIKNIVGGVPSTITEVTETAIEDLITNEEIIQEYMIGEQDYYENIVIRGPAQGQQITVRRFIESCWNTLLRNEIIMSTFIAILSLGIIAHITNRS